MGRIRKSRRGWFVRLLDRLDDRVTGPVNADARRRGWTVRYLLGSRAIEYRDPVRGRRSPCDRCGGSGLDGARRCSPCDGCGVVARRPVDLLRRTS